MATTQQVPGIEPVLQQEEEEECLTYTEIDSLQQHGIGMGESKFVASVENRIYRVILIICYRQMRFG